MTRYVAIASALGPLLLLSLPGGSGPASEIEGPTNEVEWSAKLAADVGGEAEHRLPDGSRVDILTENVAWEVEWCEPSKVYEAVGQSLFYAAATHRKPGVWLLMRPSSDEAYLKCLVLVQYCRAHGIDIELRVQRVQK